jgi:hypothetical protein
LGIAKLNALTMPPHIPTQCTLPAKPMSNAESKLNSVMVVICGRFLCRGWGFWLDIIIKQNTGAMALQIFELVRFHRPEKNDDSQRNE